METFSFFFSPKAGVNLVPFAFVFCSLLKIDVVTIRKVLAVYCSGVPFRADGAFVNGTTGTWIARPLRTGSVERFVSADTICSNV